MPPDFHFQSNPFLPAFVMDSLFPPSLRVVLKVLSTPIVIISGGVLCYLFLLPLISTAHPNAAPHISDLLVGSLLIALAIRIAIFALERFANSRSLKKTGNAESSNLAERLNFFTSELWYRASGGSNTVTYLAMITYLPKTHAGSMTLLRLGVSANDYGKFLKTYTPPGESVISLTDFASAIPPQGQIELSNLVAFLFKNDQNFHNFLLTKSIDEQSVRESALWVETAMQQDSDARRWWSKENLGRIPGIGKSWAYGPIFTLRQYAQDMRPEVMRAPLHIIGRDREIKLLEQALLKQTGANVIIIGQPGTGRKTLLAIFAQLIMEGKVFPELESKRIFKLSGPALVASGKTKGDTEKILLDILNEAVGAGDIILAIDEFPEFVESLAKIGISASQLLQPYLMHPAIHIVGIADTSHFRKVLEGDATLMQYFEKVEITEPDERTLVEILKNIAPIVEAQNAGKVYITYPAIKKIAEAGIRYIMEGALPERAINFLQEVTANASQYGSVLLSPEFVMDYASKKTKMPLGQINQEEQKMLLELEIRLHERVVNQKEAISAIADAIRRARAGIREPKRPIGSFLFLGPTGIGKTETAKALSAVYFGNEEAMVRFDMTEFQTEEGLQRLLGSFDKNEMGLLSSQMHSFPYAVVLLDEFEKADKKVIDLFLQILDEGFFTDALGVKINMRNVIIIATSNAGASLIWQWVAAGIDPADKKSEMLSAIQQEGKFKPELLNRFDSIVIFRPLTPEHLREIARLMLKKLASRLKEQQDITLQITDPLLDEMARLGYDPTFGARPMRRFIQERIEKLIANKIIKGELARGAMLTITPEEIK